MNAEPQIWTLPEEPPVGTVVGPVDEADRRRWERAASIGWTRLATAGQAASRDGMWSWYGVLTSCGGTVREYPDPSDPDGYQQELDHHLRAKVESLRADLCSRCAESGWRDADGVKVCPLCAQIAAADGLPAAPQANTALGGVTA